MVALLHSCVTLVNSLALSRCVRLRFISRPVQQSFPGFSWTIYDSSRLPHFLLCRGKVSLSFGGMGCTEKIPTGTMRVICLFISACDNSTSLIILRTVNTSQYLKCCWFCKRRLCSEKHARILPLM